MSSQSQPERVPRQSTRTKSSTLNEKLELAQLPTSDAWPEDILVKLLDLCSVTASTAILGGIDNIVTFGFYSTCEPWVDPVGRYKPQWLPGSSDPQILMSTGAIADLFLLLLDLSNNNHEDWDQIFDRRLTEMLSLVSGAKTIALLKNEMLRRTAFRYAFLEKSVRVRRSQVSFDPYGMGKEESIQASIDIPKQTYLYELNGLLAKDIYKGEAISLMMSHPSQNLSRGRRLMTGPARFVNHACEPNSELYPVTGHPLYVVKTIQDVNADDEITVNYGADYWVGSQCKCRSCVSNKDTKGWPAFDILFQASEANP